MHALIPVKRFQFAKQRLSGVLLPYERSALVAAMLEDVLAVVSRHPAIDGVLVVSDEPAARALAHRYRVEHLPESPLGAARLNGVVRAAADVLARRSVEAVMVLHADLPLIDAAEISALVEAHSRAPGPALTIAPDRHHDGSNCLVCPPAAPFQFRYGRGSFLRHLRQAAAQGAAISVLDLPGAGFDVDWPRDLRELLGRPDGRATRTGAWLAEAGLAERLLSLAAGLPGAGGLWTGMPATAAAGQGS